MSKLITSLLAAVLVVSLCFCNSAFATIYYVATNGLDTNSGTLAKPWATIQHATNTMKAGDSVYVEPGTYSSFPGVSIGSTHSGTSGSPITYHADGAVILDANYGAVNVFLINGASWIVIDGFTIRNVAGDKDCGVHLKTASNCTVENCTVYNVIAAGGTTSAAAIRLLNTSNNTIQNNHCYNSYVGISLRSYPDQQSNQTTNNLIVGNTCNDNNTVPANADGISASDWWIYNNTFRANICYHNADDGIDLWQSHNNLVEKNFSYDNGYGLDGNGNGYKLGSKDTNTNGDSGGHTVRYNIAYGNLTSGFLSNGRSNTYYNNVSYDNDTYGFYDEKESGETGSSLWNNTSTDNGIADLATWSPVTANYNNWSMPGAFNVDYNGTHYTTLASYRTACGQEGNSKNVDPNFVNAGSANFHLTSGSQLIDAGTLVQSGLTDIDGISVPQGNGVDIGSYEYH